MTLTVSIVSHGHGRMLEPLVRRLLAFPEVAQIILTHNIPEPEVNITDGRLLIVKNQILKGFGANHNAAFKLTQCDQFCVLNPDIVFTENPFPLLLQALKRPKVSLAVPRVTDQKGHMEDNLRVFLTPTNLLKRVLRLNPGTYSLYKQSVLLYPDWVAGMFMLFNASAYRAIGGFDEGYFMYCEDADICTRLWAGGYKIVACPSVAVIHLAQRASHRQLKHIMWHASSLLRYFWRHSASLPNKSDQMLKD